MEFQKAIDKRFKIKSNITDIRKSKLPVVIHFSKGLGDKKIGNFKILKNIEEDSHYNIFYPAAVRIYDDNRSLSTYNKTYQDSLSENQQEKKPDKNLKSDQNEDQTILHQLKSLNYQSFLREENNYLEKFQTFSQIRHQQSENKLISDYQKYYLERQNFPQEQLAGIEYEQSTNMKQLIPFPFICQRKKEEKKPDIKE